MTPQPTHQTNDLWLSARYPSASKPTPVHTSEPTSTPNTRLTPSFVALLLSETPSSSVPYPHSPLRPPASGVESPYAVEPAV